MPCLHPQHPMRPGHRSLFPFVFSASSAPTMAPLRPNHGASPPLPSWPWSPFSSTPQIATMVAAHKIFLHSRCPHQIRDSSSRELRVLVCCWRGALPTCSRKQRLHHPRRELEQMQLARAQPLLVSRRCSTDPYPSIVSSHLSSLASFSP